MQVALSYSVVDGKEIVQVIERNHLSNKTADQKNSAEQRIGEEKHEV
jgi:hypothetical protein